MGGARGKAKTVVEPHRHKGVFIAKGKEDLLATLNMVPGETVYGETKVTVEDKKVVNGIPETIKIEYTSIFLLLFSYFLFCALLPRSARRLGLSNPVHLLIRLA